MQKSDIFPALQQKLNAVQATVDRINTQRAELPTLERDLALKQVQQLYELLLQIECSPLYKPEKKAVEMSEKKVERKQIPTEEVVDNTPEKIEEKPVEKVTENSVKQEVNEVLTAKESQIEKEEKTHTSIPEDKPVEAASHTPKKHAEQKVATTGNLFEFAHETISDKFKSSKPSLGENLGSGVQDTSIVAQLQRKKISDIRTGIGVNDKFLFINELFSGEFKKYEEIVDKINAITDSEEAFELLDSIKEKYNWRDDLPAYRKMMSIIERKFI